MKIDFLEKLIEISEEDFGIDIKKRHFKIQLWFWENRQELKMSLTEFFSCIEATKQSFHGKLGRLMTKHEAYG